MSFRSEYLAAQAAKARQSADPAATREASLASMKSFLASAKAEGYLDSLLAEGAVVGPSSGGRAASKASMLRKLGKASG